jgi:hypothetical protein
MPRSTTDLRPVRGVKIRFVVDSLLEGEGFELSVPVRGNRFDVVRSRTRERLSKSRASLLKYPYRDTPSGCRSN